MTIITEVQERKRLNKQARAVKRYLEMYGSITDNFALYTGIPGYGIIKRLAARIGELRKEDKMDIHTHIVDGVTTYTLIREEKETAPTFTGFTKYLKKIGVREWALSTMDRATYYSEYCADIRRQNA